MFPKQNPFPKQPDFSPNSHLLQPFLLHFSNFGVSDHEASSLPHTQPLIALKSRTTMLISIFYLGIEGSTKDFPVGFSIRLSQESKHSLWKGQGLWFSLQNPERCQHFAPLSRPSAHSFSLLVFASPIFPTIDSLSVWKSFLPCEQACARVNKSFATAVPPSADAISREKKKKLRQELFLSGKKRSQGELR